MNKIVCWTLLLVAGFTAPTFALEPEVKCEFKKLKEAAKYASCRLKVEAKAVKKGLTPDFTKCQDKFALKWGKIEEKGQLTMGVNACPSLGDLTEMNDRIVEEADEIALSLSGNCDGGAVVAGSCWYLGAINESCDDACSGEGKVYDTATRTYAGSDGSIVNCTRVLGALGAPISTEIRSVGPDHIGCMVDPTGWSWDPTDTTSSDAWPVNQRVCACQ